MKTLIIACQTLENELKTALALCGCTYDIIWFESGLHNTPKKLKSTLQELIDKAEGYDKILMVMGFCGNSVAELCSAEHTLIIPRVDDCISLMLGSYKNRITIPEAGHTYFMTEGWLQGERNIWVEYQYTMEKYGEEQGKAIFDMMMGGYETLALIDTHAYDISAVEDEMNKIADALELKYRKLDGTVDYIKELLSEPLNPEKFLIVPPKTTIKSTDLIELY